MRLRRLTLHRFCGFEEFTLELGDATFLVGPNNGGKTTLLRAIRFAMEAYRGYFGGGHEAEMSRLQTTGWIYSLDQLGALLAMRDLPQFYLGRTQQERAIVELEFSDELGFDGEPATLLVRATCQHSNVSLDCRFNDVQLWGLANNNLEMARKAMNALYAWQPRFVPPIGTISAAEQQLTWRNLQSRLASGQYSETWRNQIHWMSDGASPERLQRVVSLVEQYIPNVRIRPPARTRDDDHPNIVIRYEENGTEFDISAGGGGVRTLLTLAAEFELTDAPMFLLDEPEAHLHPTVQRQLTSFLLDQAGEKRQILVATHAPDVIEEVPVDSLVWVDRKATEGRRCDSVGKALVDLGAISHSQAIQCLGADTILYFEGKPDRTIFSALMRRLGKEHLVNRCRLEVLGGFGDAANVAGAIRVLREALHTKVVAAVIRDADYTPDGPLPNPSVDGDFLIVQLPCKEIENLLLLSPDAIAEAARIAAEARALFSSEPGCSPTRDEVAEKIDEFTGASDVKQAVRPQWMARRLSSSREGHVDPGKFAVVEREFERQWAIAEWRRRHCPGKLVLRHIKRWLSAEPYHLSMRLEKFFETYEPDAELRQTFDTLDDFVTRASAGD
jgi:predicted ATPase